MKFSWRVSGDDSPWVFFRPSLTFVLDISRINPIQYIITYADGLSITHIHDIVLAITLLQSTCYPLRHNIIPIHVSSSTNRSIIIRIYNALKQKRQLYRLPYRRTLSNLVVRPP